MSKHEWKFELIGTLILFAVCLGLAALYGDCMYDDWRCGLSECRRLK